MKVFMIGHTGLSAPIEQYLREEKNWDGITPTPRQVLAFLNIRQCYSFKDMIDILETEYDKYFGEGGREGERLFKLIINSGHTSTLEHISYNFSIQEVSRALLAQLTRHRVGVSYSVQSQRYVKFSSDSRSKGFKNVIPDKVLVNDLANTKYNEVMNYLQSAYDELIGLGVPQEDARCVLPNSASVDLGFTINLRSFMEFYKKRKSGKGAQKEITDLAEQLKESILSVDEWLKPFFDEIC